MKHMIRICDTMEEKEKKKDVVWHNIYLYLYMVTCAYKTFTALGRNRMWDEFFMKFYARFLFSKSTMEILRQCVYIMVC